MRRLAWVAAPFCSGVFLAQYLLPEAAWRWAALISLLLFAGIVLTKGPKRARLALAGLAAAFGWCALFHAVVYAPAEARVGTEGVFSAVVLDVPTDTGYGVRLPVKLEGEGRVITALLYLDEKAASLEPGDRVRGEGSIRSAAWSRGETVTWYTAKGIFLRVYGKENWTVERGAVRDLDTLYARLAHRLETVVSTVLEAEQAGFVTALLTGNRAELTDEFTTSLSRTGLAHVVAVSGMHMTFLVGLLTLPIRNRRRLSLWCIPVLLLFAGTAGFTPSITRAMVMQIIVLLAPALGRENDPPTTLSAALFVLLAVNPYSAHSMGLQLSFASVAGILLIAQPLYRWMEAGICRRTGKKRLAGLWAAAATGVSATLGAMTFTMPLSAYYFETVSLVAPLANLLVLWAVSILFGLGMLMALAGCVWLPAARLLAVPMSALSVYVAELTEWLSSLSFAAVPARSVHMHAWVLSLFLVVLLLRAGKTLRRWWPVPMVLLAAGFCMALAFSRTEATAGDFNITVLDVDQGQCVLAYTKGGAVAVDCGGSSLDDPGELLADRLLELGRDELDLLVLTHFHSDHANGVEALFRRVKVRAMALPDVDRENPIRTAVLTAADKQGTELIWITDDQTVEVGGMTLRLYAPLGAGERNEEGLSVLCSVGENDLLITGDMTSDVEKRLVKYGGLPRVEVLLAGHHGSKYATGTRLLEAVRPERAVISVGYNTYGHPTREVLSRLEAVGAEVHRTDLQGDVTVQFRGVG